MKSPPKPKKKVQQKLSQKDKFIEYARELKVDETGDRLEQFLKTAVKKVDK